MCTTEKGRVSLTEPQLSPVVAQGFPSGLQRLDYRSPVDDSAGWAMLLPPASGIRIWVVVIHGHGSHGNQLYVRKDLQRYWLPQYQQRGLGVLTPDLRGNAWMGPSAVTDMDALLNFLRDRYAAERFIFSSGSMGGTSNLIYAALRPGQVDGVIVRGGVCDLAAYWQFCRNGEAALPILAEIADALEENYGGPPDHASELYRRHSPLFHPEALMTIPMFLCHGTADRLMPVEQPRRLIGALAGHPRLAYCEVPDGSHDAPLALGLAADSFCPSFSALDWVMA